MNHNRRTDFSLTLLLFLLPLIFFYDAIFLSADQIIYGSDFTTQFYPIGDFAFEQFRQGNWPLWNPHTLLGVPQFAEPQFSTFYPPLWLAARLPTNVAFGVLYAFHFGLAAAGGYWLLRRLDSGPAGAFLAALIFGFNNFMTARIYAGHFAPLMTMAYLPWCLAAVHALAHKKRWLFVPLTAVPLALALLAGSASFFPLLLVALTAVMGWLLWRTYQSDGKTTAAKLTAQFTAVLLFAPLLAAVQIIPTIQFFQYSNRTTITYEFASSFSFPLQNLLALAMPFLLTPDQLSDPAWQGYHGSQFWEYALYAGVLPLILFMLSCKSGQRSWRFWHFLAGGGLLVAIGPAGVVHRLLFQFAPGFDAFRAPSRFAFLFTLSAAVLSGLMFDAWLKRPPTERQAVTRQIRPYLLATTAVLITLAIIMLSFAAEPTPDALRESMANDLLLAALLLFGSTILLFQQGWANRPRLLTAAITLLLLLDLWSVGSRFIVIQPAEPELGWLMADLVLPPERTSYRVATRAIAPNSAYFFGFHNVFGYDGFYLESSDTLYRESFHDARLARLLSTRYLLYANTETQRPGSAAGWERLTEPAGVIIDQREDYLPRAFIVHELRLVESAEAALETLLSPEFDPAQTAVVHSETPVDCPVQPLSDGSASAALLDYQPTKLTIQTTTPQPSWLIVNDTYYPGWEAWANGQKLIVHPTDYGLRGICLPAGDNLIVEMIFNPPILQIGGWVTATAVLILLLTTSTHIWLFYRRSAEQKVLSAESRKLGN